jgi:hypothetical protein
MKCYGFLKYTSRVWIIVIFVLVMIEGQVRGTSSTPVRGVPYEPAAYTLRP